MTSRGRWSSRLLGLAVAAIAAGLLAGCASGAGSPAPEAGAPVGSGGGEVPVESADPELGGGYCALEMTYQGRPYDPAPMGPPDRAPVLTGRTVLAQLPGCDDGSGALVPEDVEVREIAGVGPDTAVWWDDAILLARGKRLPESLAPLFRPATCRFSGSVEVSGRWLGVLSSKPARFDGDLRTPLRIDLYVEDVADPAVDLERYTISIRDVGDAMPALDKAMAEEALWSSSAALKVSVACVDGEFRATSFDTVPR
jgi:hypothetical protein